MRLSHGMGLPFLIRSTIVEWSIFYASLRVEKYLMRKFGILLMAGMWLTSCSPDPAKTMIVEGNVKGLKKGTLYLQKLPDTTLITLDSVTVDGNGEFRFTTPIESPEIFYLYLKKEDQNDINDRITFFGEPGTIHISTTWNGFDTQSKIEGLVTQEKFEEYSKVMSRFNLRQLELTQQIFEAAGRADSLTVDSLQQTSILNTKREYAYALNYALSHTDSYIAPYIAVKEVGDANVKYLDSIYNGLSPEVAESKYGKELRAHLAEIKK